MVRRTDDGRELSVEQRHCIISSYEAGQSSKELAEEYKCSKTAIRWIVQGFKARDRIKPHPRVRYVQCYADCADCAEADFTKHHTNSDPR